MSRPRVLLTNTIDPAGDRILEEIADVVLAPDTTAPTLLALGAEVDVIVVRANLPENIFDRPNRLIGVVRHGVGLDMIPMAAATAHGIPVANVPAVNAPAVAEYCIGTMLMLTRRLHELEKVLRSGDWSKARAMADDATEIGGRTIGIVGVGNVGRRLAEICHFGFRMRVLGHQRHLNALPEFVEAADLDTLFRESDFIVLACPLTDETHHLVNAQRLATMKPTAAIINVARGPVVDEQALVEALAAKRIGAAVLDVYERQPLAADHPVRGRDNAILTPHVAGLTQEAMRAISVTAAQEVARLLRSERPVNLVNPEVWDKHLARMQARS